MSQRALDLALLAFRKRQSPRTRMVHFFPDDPSVHDTIPIYENFCFALALFRQKTVESVLEGKELIERLLAFQTAEGNFPVCLHEYPRAREHHLALKIAPIFIHLINHFGAVLSSSFKEKIETSLKRLLNFAKDQTLAPWAKQRLLACEGTWEADWTPQSASDWFEWIVSSQLVQETSHFPIPYHPSMGLLAGHPLLQEKKEPQPQPLEYLLGEAHGMHPRLQNDHPHQMYASLLFPLQSTLLKEDLTLAIPHGPKGKTIYWKEENELCSLSIPEIDGSLFELSAREEVERNDLFEISLYLNLSPKISLLINGAQGILFHLSDQLLIRTPSREFSLCFSLVDGEGDFCGRIFRGNRPNQISAKGSSLHEAYDWRIALRTLRRKGPCKITLSLHETNR